MVKIKINKSLLYKKLNEAEGNLEETVKPEVTDDNWDKTETGGSGTRDEGSSNTEGNSEESSLQTQSLQTIGISEELLIEDFVINEYDKLIKDVPLMNIKFDNVYDAFKKILFPTGSSLLSNLLVKIDLPKKFLNTKSMITDPESHIKHTSDLAKKYFNDIDLDWLSSRERDKKSVELTPFKPSGLKKNINESALGTAALGVSAFSVAYKGIGKVGALLFSDFDSLGYNFSDLYSTNKKKDPGVTNGDLDDTKSKASEIKNLPSAIDSYIQDILSVMSNLLHLWYGDNRQEIKTFILTVSLLLGGAGENINKYLNSKNQILQEIERNKNEKEIINYLRKINKAQEYSNLLIKGQKKNGEALTDEERKKLADKISDTLGGKRITNIDDDDFELNESETESNSNSTNNTETSSSNNIENGKKDKVESFDADEVYNKIIEVLTPLVQDIINLDPENVNVIKKARELMQTMKENASKNVVDRIKLVCKTEINSNNSDLGSQASAFLSKHPIQANRLLDVWRSHEQDLQDRIDRRIKTISTISDVSPLTMYKQFIGRVFPNLMALMITYKTILMILMDKRNQSKSTKKIISTIDEGKLREVATGYATSMKFGVSDILKLYNLTLSNGLNSFIDDKGNIDWNNVSPYFSYMLANLCNYPLGQKPMTIEDFCNNYMLLRNITSLDLLSVLLVNFMLLAKGKNPEMLDLKTLRSILNNMKPNKVPAELDDILKGLKLAYNTWKNANTGIFNTNQSASGGERLDNILAFMCIAYEILKENPEVIKNPSYVIDKYFYKISDIESIDPITTSKIFKQFLGFTFFDNITGNEIFNDIFTDNSHNVYDKYILLLCFYYGLGMSNLNLKNDSGNNKPASTNLNENIEDMFLLEVEGEETSKVEGGETQGEETQETSGYVEIGPVDDKYISNINTVVNYLNNQDIIQKFLSRNMNNDLLIICKSISNVLAKDINTFEELLKNVYADLNIIDNVKKYNEDDRNLIISKFKEKFNSELGTNLTAEFKKIFNSDKNKGQGPKFNSVNSISTFITNLNDDNKVYKNQKDKEKIEKYKEAFKKVQNNEMRKLVSDFMNLILSYFTSFNPIGTGLIDIQNKVNNFYEGLYKIKIVKPIAFFTIDSLKNITASTKVLSKIPELNEVEFNILEFMKFLQEVKNWTLLNDPNNTPLFKEGYFDKILDSISSDFNKCLTEKYKNNKIENSIFIDQNSKIQFIKHLILFDNNKNNENKVDLDNISISKSVNGKTESNTVKNINDNKQSNSKNLSISSYITKNDLLVFYETVFEFLSLTVQNQENVRNLTNLYRFIIGLCYIKTQYNTVTYDKPIAVSLESVLKNN